MSLTVKQRAKINAALCLIHDRGGSADAVTAMANNIMATGHSPASAYDRAIGQFAASNPHLTQGIAKLSRLIEASDYRTVAQYDVALSNYIATGDDSGLRALAPTIAQDSLKLAVQHGEVNAADASAAALGTALGFDPGADFVEAATAPPAIDSGNGDMIGHDSAEGQSFRMVAPKAQREWAEGSTYQGFAPSSAPAATGDAPQGL